MLKDERVYALKQMKIKDIKRRNMMNGVLVERNVYVSG